VNDRAAKALYCQAIGLTPAWIDAASSVLLHRACENLGYHGHMVVPNMRMWLHSFLSNAEVPAMVGAPQQAAVVIDLAQ